jgi:hypothetical protein
MGKTCSLSHTVYMSAFKYIASQVYEDIDAAAKYSAEQQGNSDTGIRAGSEPWSYQRSLDHLTSLREELARTPNGKIGSETQPDILLRLASVLETWNEHLRQLRGDDAFCVVELLQEVSHIAMLLHAMLHTP